MVVSCFLKVREFNFVRLNEFTTQLKSIIEEEFSNKITLNEIKLPTTKKKFTVLNSPHVHKKSREQFELCTHKRLYCLKGPSRNIKDILSIIENLGQDFSIKFIK